MNQHINNTCKVSFFHIRALRHIRPSLSVDQAKMIASAVVSTRLDYCNSLLEGTSDININKLQRVQNSLARVVTGSRRSDHITPILAQLHWLPVKSRITFKIATLVYKIRSTHQPVYLASLLENYEPNRNLRSSGQNTLSVPATRTTYGDRAFRHTAASTWNSLPSEIRDANTLSTFRSKLKTYLYKLSFLFADRAYNWDVWTTYGAL